MQYFIDIGNTRIKYTAAQAVAQSVVAPSTQSFKVQTASHDKLQPIYDAILQENPSGVYLVSGRSAHARQAHDDLVQFCSAQCLSLNIVSVKPELLSINYQDIKQFGCDRFLNLLAARQRYQKQFCVISAGTAITLDFYTHQHIGGMILLGIGSLKNLLASKTGLTTIEKPECLLGHDTASSIGAGIYVGYQNLIDGSVERIARREHANFQKIWTGGDAEALYSDGEIVHHLLFEGMCIYSRVE